MNKKTDIVLKYKSIKDMPNNAVQTKNPYVVHIGNLQYTKVRDGSKDGVYVWTGYNNLSKSNKRIWRVIIKP